MINWLSLFGKSPEVFGEILIQIKQQKPSSSCKPPKKIWQLGGLASKYNGEMKNEGIV